MSSKMSSNSVSASHFKVFVGTLVHSTRNDPMMIMKDKVIGVHHNKIKFMSDKHMLDQLQKQYRFQHDAVTFLSNRQFLMPGLIDTHIHASQHPNNGMKLDLDLLEWLQKYTFPTEAAFSDPKFAKDVYTRAVDCTLRNGTTTASYFATKHLDSTKLLADAVCAGGQRALVGKVNMLHNCPDNYKEDSIEESITETQQLISYIENLKNPLLHAVVTPRFAITCPHDQMTALANLAAKNNCHIQTHVSESRPEVKMVSELFPTSRSYVDVYKKAGLLTKKTILAHCIWVDDEDMNVLAKEQVGISHCPNSNISILSGFCNVPSLLEHGIKVSLGTDCSGGYSPSILNAIRMCLVVSKTHKIQDPQHKVLTLADAFRLATLGGAQVLNMEDRIGNLEVGKEFDALLIDVMASDSPLDIYDRDGVDECIEKFLYNGDDRNIIKVFVAGKCVRQRTNK